MLTKYSGFIQIYHKHVDKLTNYINIYPVFSSVKSLRNVPVKLKAMWDTGATITAIKPEILDRLKAPLINSVPSKKIVGIGGKIIEADFTLINIEISDNFVIEKCATYVMDFPKNFDIIIGMDIIGMGDFTVCNTNNTTSFTFAMPPFPERLNYAEKANIFNEKQQK